MFKFYIYKSKLNFIFYYNFNITLHISELNQCIHNENLFVLLFIHLNIKYFIFLENKLIKRIHELT